jgi:threonine dehydratase/serine racemase
MRLSDADAARGVVTHSSGNHAQALALAARLRGVPAHIVMPSTASPVKRRAVEGYGARVVTCEPGEQARTETADEVLAETGGVFVPPYDHRDIIAGQGTVMLELLEQVEDLDAVIAPVGGGGLLSGIATVAASAEHPPDVYGAEPAGADDAARSLAAGRCIPQTDPRTVCDGLLTSLGELTWPIIRDRVAGVITIEDDRIVATMRLVWERAKIIIETNAAVAVAAAIEGLAREGGPRRVAVVVSGGNVDLDHLPWCAQPQSPQGGS